MFLQCSAGIYSRKCSLLFSTKVPVYILSSHIGREVAIKFVQFEVEEDLYFCHLATNRFISGENPQAENNSSGTDAYWRKIIIGG